MATLQEFKDLIQNIDTKLDEVKARIDTLSAGQTISQEDLDALYSSLSAVSAETSALVPAAEETIPETEEEE